MTLVQSFRFITHLRVSLKAAGFLFLAIALRAEENTASSADNSLSPFGIGACNQTSQMLNKWIPQMAKIGLKSMRACRTSFGDVEPEEGKWTWDRLDGQLKYAEENHMEFCGLLLGSPKWNTKDHPNSLPVHNLPAWSTYVSEVVKHAKGKIKHWEVWNEPPNFTGKDQTPEDYAKIVASAYDAAKAADPDCMVGLAAKSVHVNYLERVIKAGARDHFDYITVHPYEVLGTVSSDAGTEAVFMNIVPTLRKMLAAQNPAKANVPIWFTEIGTDTRKGADLQAQTLVKAYAMGIAQGVACINWFEGMDGDSGPMGLLEHNGKPRPAYTAMAQMIEHLGTHPIYLGWVLLNQTNYGFIFQGSKSTVLITWAYKGVASSLDFGHPVQLIDPVAGQSSNAAQYHLTSAPVLVIDPPAELVTQAKANLAKPLPWNGDYSKAEAVTLTQNDQKTEEKGLHTLAGASIAADVVAYGGSARAGDVPGGNMFVVDPSFLSYTPTPIEITIVVRRNPANDNAGFNLVYESTTGFKHAGGWYTVPDNKEWHTKTWRIDDAQFVHYWGYNFTFNSDGNQLNKYYLQSVTVRKLAH